MRTSQDVYAKLTDPFPDITITIEFILSKLIED